MVKDLLKTTRSYRRFDESRTISDDVLRDIVGAVRFCPSAANLQRVRVAIVNDSLQNDMVFEDLSFAAYLKDWKGPKVGERPVAYLVIMTENKPDVNLAIDIGICAEAMLLVAREYGIGGCLFRSFSADTLCEKLGRQGLVPSLVIALGYPSETVVIDDASGGDIKYYRDENDVHHVPKISLDTIIV